MSTTILVAYVPAASLDAAEAAAAAYLVSPNSPGVNTFSVPLSPDGAGTPTAWGVAFPAAAADPIGSHLAGILGPLGGRVQAFSALGFDFFWQWVGGLAAWGLIPIREMGGVVTVSPSSASVFEGNSLSATATWAGSPASSRQALYPGDPDAPIALAPGWPSGVPLGGAGPYGTPGTYTAVLTVGGLGYGAVTVTVLPLPATADSSFTADRDTLTADRSTP